jgi:hypothetical protein
LKILRTLCAVNQRYNMGLNAEDCCEAVVWLDKAIDMLEERAPAMPAFIQEKNIMRLLRQ